MTPHSEKGDARRAAEVLDARMNAVSGGDDGITFDLATADVNRRSGEMRSTNAVGVAGAYGDLFDVGEVVALAAAVCEAFLVDIATERRDPMSAMISIYLNAAALGCLMERERWRRGER